MYGLDNLISLRFYCHDVNPQEIQIALEPGLLHMVFFRKDNFNEKDHKSLAADVYFRETCSLRI